MRPSGPTESDQQVSESGLRENGYHLTGYGASPGDLASASKAGTRFAESAVVPIFINVRRSISCPELIHSSVVDQKPGDYIPDRGFNQAFSPWRFRSLNDCNGGLSLIDAHQFARFGTSQDNCTILATRFNNTYEQKWEQSGKRLSCIRYEGGWLGRNEMGVSVGNACDYRVARF